MQEEDSSFNAQLESEDDFDWEEVVVPQPEGVAQQSSSRASTVGAHEDTEEGPSSRPTGNIEITIQTKKHGRATKEKNLRAQQLASERLARLQCHQIHTVCLLANARIRNKWINDPLLHARLISLTPLDLQLAFGRITKSRYPEAAQRGHVFESAITRLTEWWSRSFRVESDGHIRSRTFEEMQKILKLDTTFAQLYGPQTWADAKDKGTAKVTAKSKRKGKERAIEMDLPEDFDTGEVIKSEKSLMKHALMFRGSRDTSAQLFAALCRALGIPTRLVVSLQSVPWQANAGKPKTTAKKKPKDNAEDGDATAKGKAKSNGKGKEKAKGATHEESEGNGNIANENDEDMEMEEVDIPSSSPAKAGPSKGKVKEVFAGSGQRLDGGSVPLTNGEKGKIKAPPVINLRKGRGKKLGTTTGRPPRRERTPDPADTAPVFWTEVFSRADAKWIPIDPIRCIVNRRKAFDPSPNPLAMVKPDRMRPTRVENRMVYVVAFEEDGYARDVTPRYAREYGAKVAKVQQGGKGRRQWWERIMAMVTRPYRLQRDDLEDDELQANQLTERMPTTLSGFKDHPLYVLERHLKRDEVVHPPTEIGKFRGEPVYPRAHVLSLKTAENWMRQGRNVREGCQPLKWVKQRAVTVHKKRAIEMALTEQKDRGTATSADEKDGFASEEGVLQGLYSEDQTEEYVPDPVIDGKVPKNDFGNIDLYVPSMLPAGGAYIPYKGAAKAARQLGFDFAEAVTGFEFKKRRAFPVIGGIVVAAENEQAVLEAFWEAEQEAEEKRRAKREEQVIKRWTKLVQGLRIRQRLQEQYASAEHRENSIMENEEDAQPEAGGFLTTADEVVQPFTLPKSFYHLPKTSTTISLATAAAQPPVDQDEEAYQEHDTDTAADLGASTAADIPEEFEDLDMEEVEVPASIQHSTAIPRTIRELAEAAAEQHEGPAVDSTVSRPLSPPPAAAAANGVQARSTRATTRSGAGTSAGGQEAQAAPPVTGRRGRKRARDDSNAEAITSEEVRPQPLPTKRAQPTRKLVAPVPASDRVLRTRASKTASQMQQERESERAYRRAVAE